MMHEVGVTSLGEHIPGTDERYTWLQTVKTIIRNFSDVLSGLYYNKDSGSVVCNERNCGEEE